MADQHVLDLLADRADRIECCARILEDHRDFATPQVAHHRLVGVMQPHAAEVDGAGDDVPGAVEDAHHRVRGHRFAGTRFADDAQGFAARLAALSAQLPPNRIGKAGQLQEGQQDWDMQAPEIHHRHISHLYGLHPSAQINLRDTPELARAEMWRRDSN